MLSFKMNITNLLLVFSIISTAVCPQAPFITTWKTDNPGSSNSTSITIPTTGTGYNYDVDWNNDGVYDQFGITGDVMHDYGMAGNYTIRIRGTFPSIYFNYTGDCQKILSVDQWGSINWMTMEYAFSGASNLVINAIDVPDLSLVSDMSFMFAESSSFNQNIGNWKISTVTNMSGMFSFATTYTTKI